MTIRNAKLTSSAANCCSGKVGFVAYAMVLVVVQVMQGAALNYYLVKIFKEYFTVYFFFVSDFVCLFIFIGTLVMAYRHINKTSNRRSNTSARRERENRPAFRVTQFWYAGLLATLPLIYIAWSAYVTVLVVKVMIIFRQGFSDDLNFRFGHQLLQVIIGLSCIVFWLLVECRYWTKNVEYGTLMAINKRTGIEIFDSVEMLSLLMEDKNITGNLETLVLVLACSNFVYPLLSLYELNELKINYSIATSDEVGNQNSPTPGAAIVHNAVRLFLVDIPFFIVRLYLWLVCHEDLSMFMMKNFFHIVLGAYQLFFDWKKRYCSNRPENTTNAPGIDNFVEIPLTATDGGSKIVQDQIDTTSNVPS